jgi:hypothetical protein
LCGIFAASHGKSPCDGISGRRLAAWASLEANTTDHILTAQQLFLWADSNILGINFLCVLNTDLMLLKDDEEASYKNAIKVPGTRNHHCLIQLATAS